MATVIKKVSSLAIASTKKILGLGSYTQELYSHPLYSGGNLVAYYRFEGNSNATTGGVNGSDSNMSYNASYGKFNQGASFNGSSSQISLADNNIFSITTANKLTWSFWVRLGSLSTQQDILYKGSGTYEYWISVETNGRLRCTIWSGAGNNRYDSETVTSAIAINNWYHVVITVDDSITWASTNCKIYINGVHATNGYGGSSSNTLSNGGDALIVGYRNNRLNGYLDDLAIFNKVLSATEVSELYNFYIKKFASVSNT